MTTTIDSYVVRSDATRGGKPVIVGTRMAVADVAMMHLRMGQSLEQIAARYDLSLASAPAAMAYYYDHREEIDRGIDADDAYLKAARGQNPLLLQAKLKAQARIRKTLNAPR